MRLPVPGVSARLGVALAFGFGLASTAQSDTQPGVQRVLEFDGYVRASREAELSTFINNTVTNIGFHAGQYVEEGDLLFEFAKRAAMIELQLSETSVSDARAQLALAEADLARKAELQSRELISEAEWLLARAQSDRAEIALKRAELALEGAQLAFSFTEIRAHSTES